METIFKNNQKYLMVFGCHHKVGTSWFTSILTHVAREFNLVFQYSQQIGVNKDTDIFFDDHSRLDVSLLKNYRGVHLIRDPRDVIVSGMFYHRWTSESWANEPKDQWDGMTYKQKINSFDNIDDAILFEMENVGRETISEMMRWNYANENFLEVRYEELLKNQEEQFVNIFNHYNFSRDAVTKCIEIANNYSFERMKKRTNSEHLRRGVAGDWKEHFSKKNIDLFNSLFPDVFDILSYD